MPGSDLNLFLRTMQANGPLPKEDCAAILDLPFTRREMTASTYLMREGELSSNFTVLLSGFAFCHKLVGNGGRQIVSLHTPGEAIDFRGLYLDRSDHNAQALTQVDIAAIPVKAMRQLIDERPAIMRAVLLETLLEASILREWITNIGRRDARTRLAHLLCEFATRLDAQGIASASYELPLTQEQIGDALGLTSVHVNRSIKVLEAEGLITRNRRLLRVPDLQSLREVGDFTGQYLHTSRLAATA